MDQQLADYIKRVLGTDRFFDDLPGFHELCGRAFGSQVEYWRISDQSDITNKLLCAALFNMVRGLQTQLKDLADKAQIVQAAERGWRPMLRARRDLVFTNGLGEVVAFPVEIARLIAARKGFDGQVVEKAGRVQFEVNGTVVATIPKSLMACLEKVLEGGAWDSLRG